MPVTLTNAAKVPVPSWLSDTSASDSLKSFQTQLPGLFDTSGLQSAAQNYNQSFANRAEMGFDAQARAAQNRAMLNGGRVGSSFTKGGLMLGLNANTNELNYKFAQMAQQAKAQQAGLTGQVAGQLADYGQRHQGQLADWTQGQQQMGLSAQQANQNAAMERARLAQQASQFGNTFGLQQQQYADQRNDRSQALGHAAQQQALAMAQMNPMGSGDMGDNDYGYIPDFGPVHGARLNGTNQPNNVYTPEAFQTLYGGFKNGNLPIPTGGGGYNRWYVDQMMAARQKQSA